MANAVNTTTSNFGAGHLHPAWDKEVHWQLRTKPLFRQFSEVRASSPTNNSRVVYLPVEEYEDVAANRHVVDEVVAADQVQATEPTYVRLTLAEHGHRMGRTELLDVTSYIPLDPKLARKMSAHMADTLDAMVADVLYDGDRTTTTGSAGSDTVESFTQVASSDAGAFEFTAAADNTLVATDILSSRIVARVHARLTNAAAMPYTDSGEYVGLISPDTQVSFQEDTGALGWSEPHKYVDTSNIYSGEIGTYRGIKFVVSPRARKLAGAGSGGLDVEQTLIMGREVLGEYTKREPGPGVGPVLDGFGRHRDIFWYGILGFAIFRQEPLWRIHHTAE